MTLINSMEIGGDDIVITDPLYIVGDNLNWDICNYGNNLDNIGFKNFISFYSIYGDLSCTVYRDDNKNKLGRFVSDSGMICVVSLSECFNYNRTFNLFEEKPWSATIIPAFSGTIRAINYGGSEIKDCDIRIVGRGSINFTSRQTGF